MSHNKRRKRARRSRFGGFVWDRAFAGDCYYLVQRKRGEPRGEEKRGIAHVEPRTRVCAPDLRITEHQYCIWHVRQKGACERAHQARREVEIYLQKFGKEVRAMFDEWDGTY